MRKMTYMSPTSVKKFYDDRELFYMEYLSDAKKIRDAQTGPMAVGSSFDAYVKSALYKRFVDKGDPQFSFEALFEAQVEAHNRDVARVDGKKVFDFYEQCGAMADLTLDMQGCIGDPRFETKIEGTVRQDIHDVPLLGKPDIFFITKDGARIIFDWKVNGYYSNNAVSPKPGYKRTRPDGVMHKNCFLRKHNGYDINDWMPFEKTDEEWAAQLSTYGWLLGEEIGSSTILAVDQIACNKPKGYMRVAQHRGVCSAEFQHALYNKYAMMWQSITSGHIFDNMTREDSDKRCQMLDGVSVVHNEMSPEFKAALGL